MINASLFALIQNDAFLSGTYGLQGHFFINTIRYLKEYFEMFKREGESIDPEYLKLMQDIEYLVRTEEDIEACKKDPSAKTLEQIAETIAQDFKKLEIGQKLLIPGGWHNADGGHAMVYQFSRDERGYRFTVFNSGAGIQYHAKKSIAHKELYNPAKTWVISKLETDKDKLELKYFLERLLRARLPVRPGQASKAMTDKVLYEEILPGISYISGVEIDLSQDTPEHVYTGGQLSGTCAQRCIHQMLKMNSKYEEVYQRFIFKFKIYALVDYAKACLDGSQPFSSSVATQIYLAIENNLKILNIPGLFTDSESEHYFKLLKGLKQTVSDKQFDAKSVALSMIDDVPSNTLYPSLLTYPTFSISTAVQDIALFVPITLKNGTNLLAHLNAATQQINGIQDPATQYFYLEKLVLSLPLNQRSNQFVPFYAELTTLDHYKKLQSNLDDIQDLLNSVREKWLKEAQSKRFNHLVLSVLSLQADAHNVIAEKSHLPSFERATDTMMASLIDNHHRDPFEATHHAIFDLRILTLRKRFSTEPHIDENAFQTYLKNLLLTEPSLYEELKELYNKNYGKDTSKLHREIRDKGMEVLFVISEHMKHEIVLDLKFNPIIDKVKSHFTYETRLRAAINPFFMHKLSFPNISPDFIHDKFTIRSPLYPVYLAHQELSRTITEHKYVLRDSPARDALQIDLPKTSTAWGKIKARTANHIQLGLGTAYHEVTQADILARDFYHLRCDPSLQVVLTVDYFTRNIEKLSDEANQLYIEANLFQPGLLKKALKQETFINQFDKLLKDGKRFFNQDGLYTRNSLQFLRLDFLVSRYMTQMKLPKGIARLEKIQEDLQKQLVLSQNSNVIYVLQQYLFLTIMARIEINADEKTSELYVQAFNAYFYLMGHTNPLIHHDTAQNLELDNAFIFFKIIAKQQSEQIHNEAVTQALISSKSLTNFALRGKFPTYRLIHQGKIAGEINVACGKFFEEGFSRSGVPLVIQNHPLMKQLGFQDVKECLMSADGTYMILKHNDEEVFLFYKDDCLTIQKNWTVNGQTHKYELQALSPLHLAKYANKNLRIVTTDLPRSMTDGSMNYWRSVTNEYEGLLTCNNVPVYSVVGGVFKSLDERGMETSLQLIPIADKWRKVLHAFESSRFLLSHRDLVTGQSSFTLPRYGLSFSVDAQDDALVLQETGERVVADRSPIHSAVAGLVLQNKDQSRYLMPVTRFYPNERGSEISDFYSFIHDTQGTIADALLAEHWKSNPPLQTPLWYYENSEHYLSFQLQEGELTADTLVGALYLVYVYLASNQPQKAWKTIEECTTRFGGLKGSADELKFISWICKDIPHILPSTKSEFEKGKPIRNTPSYVACQLRTISLITDFFKEGNKFDLKEPRFSECTANSQYALLQHEETQKFLSSLPEIVYQKYSRFQVMTRYLEDGYRLSKTERKSLLDYYQQPRAQALGALGYEWTSLSLEILMDEYHVLLAKRSSGSFADEKRLAQIKAHLSRFQPVMARSTELELVAIDLSLPLKKDQIEKPALKKVVDEYLDSLFCKADSTSFSPDLLCCSLDLLSSKISYDDFLSNFPKYLQIAHAGSDETRKPLLDFCTRTLIAKRHISLGDQDSDLALLCNILYRIAENRGSFLSAKPKNLAELLKITSAYVVPDLKVYQAKDVHKEILTTAEAIIAQQKKQVRQAIAVSPIPSPQLIEQIGLQEGLLLDELIKEYQQIQETIDCELESLGKTLTDDLEQSFLVEKEAGKIQRVAEKRKHGLADRLLQEPLLTAALETAARAAEVDLQALSEGLWSEVLKLANQGPDDPKQAKTWTIEREARSRAMLTKADLLALYLHADLTELVEKTGLSIKNAQALHASIHHVLVHEIRQQSASKLAKTIKKASETHEINLAVQALDILARAEIPGMDTPALVLLQHEEQILLYKRQVAALKSLLASRKDGEGFNEVIEKIIMGGGKSKVIIPILVEQKASGNNLVIIEVPHALAVTNYEDLNRTSQRLFSKRAYRFDFNRDSNCSPERLEQIYRQFTEIMTSKAYLVTTAEAMQSLELKYLELMFAAQDDEIAQKQIYWCDKILNLTRHYGDCVIDEVHQGLSIKKKLNYTSGESVPIHLDLAKNATALFNLIDPEFIRTAAELGDEYDWTEFKTTLATKLINEPTSPLNRFIVDAVLKFGPEVKTELIAYLTNTAQTACQAVLQANADEKAALAFFKEEICVVLSKTLCSRLDVNYGASKRPDLNPVERTLAIPYAGNNIANERNRFGNVLRAINYTIQMMLIKGISEELLKERISQWQVLARQELFQNTRLKCLDDTPTAKGFALLASSLGFTLSQINLGDKRQFSSLYDHFKYNQALIFLLLQEQTLIQIHHNAEIIHSDSFNHVDLYRSVQGVSGTPYNYTTYHKRFDYNKTLALGTDGYIIELIDDKKTGVSHVDYQNVYQFIEAALSQSEARERTRAIIDIRATFLGISNLFVAQEIARYLCSIPNQTLKHVLYFDENQILCAIDITKPSRAIVLATSDEKEISRLLGSIPSERFTYYDQVHTVGTDIKQDQKAHALVLVDDKTSLQAFLQGSMRMRELSQDQSMEIIVSAGLKQKSHHELIAHFEKVDRENLLQDNLSAAQLQMTNFIRRMCLSIIQDLPSEEVKEKRKRAKIFKSFFVDTPVTDLFKLYGGISKPQALRAILARHQKHLLDIWTQCLASADDLATFDVKINEGLEEIIAKAVPCCLKEYDAFDDSFATEVEVQTELQIEKQIEQMSLNEFYDPKLIEADYIPRMNMNVSFLNVRCSSAQQKVEFFSETLMMSENYSQVYQGQKSLLDAFLKPVFLIWYFFHNDVLGAIIITPQEERYINKDLFAKSWIATTQDTVVWGNPPQGIIHDEHYLKLREQVRFFNGEFGSLLNQETPLEWLKIQTTEKLDFFEKSLMPYRPGSRGPFQQIKAALTQVNVDGFDYLYTHRFEDLSAFDWKKLYPKIMLAHALEYQRVAEAFVFMNQNWSTKELELIDLQNQFNLPLNSLEYVNRHLSQLKDFKEMINCLDSAHIDYHSFRSKAAALLGISISEPNAMGLDSMPKIDTENVSMLLSLRAHRVIQVNSSSKKRLNQALVDAVVSADDLQSILTSGDLSEDLIMQIIERFLWDMSYMDKIMHEIWDLSVDFSDDTLFFLLGKCTNQTQIDRFFTKAKLSPSFLDTLVTEKTVSEVILCRVLCRDDLSEELISKVLHHKLFNDTVKHALLDRSGVLSGRLLLELVGCCDTTEQLAKLAKRGDLDESVVRALLCKITLLNEEIILSVLERHRSRNIYNSILVIPNITTNVLCALVDQEDLDDRFLSGIMDKPAVTDEIRQRIFNHKNATRFVRGGLYEHLRPEYLLSLIASGKSIEESELLELLEHPTAINKQVLQAIAAQSIDERVVLAIISHHEADDEIARVILNRSTCSVSTAKEILKRFNRNPETMRQLVSRIIDERGEGFQALFSQSCDYIKKNNMLKEMMSIMVAKQTNMDLNFILLDTFGKEMAQHLPLAQMIEAANAVQLDLLLDSNKTGILSEQLLLLLVARCISVDSLEKLIHRPDLTEAILHTVVSNKENLNVESLLQILKHPQVTDEIRKYVYLHKNAENSIRKALRPHLKPEYLLSLLEREKPFNSNEWVMILKDSKAVTKDVLHAIVDKSSVGQGELTGVINHKNIDDVLLKKVIDHQDFSLFLSQHVLAKKDLKDTFLIYFAKKIFAKCSSEVRERRAWENMLLTVLERLKQKQAMEFLKVNKVAPRLGIGLFREYGEEVLEHFNLSQLIAEVDPRFLQLFVNLKRRLELDELEQLAQKAESSIDIDCLLARAEMTANIAEILIHKSQYSGEVGNWQWLTKEQLLFLLEKTNSYESFRQVLVHPNLEKIARDQWLATTMATQIQRSKLAAKSGDHQEKILAVLDALKVQASKHALRSLHDPNYAEVARKAFELYHTLHRHVDVCFKAECPNLRVFHKNCMDAIDKAQPVLNQHRGYKQTLLDILNVILAYISFRAASINSGKWRFFEANTASMNIVKEVSTLIDNTIKLGG